MTVLFKFRSFIFTVCFSLIAVFCFGQGSTLNSLADNDDYTVLRNLVGSSIRSTEPTTSFAYRIYNHTNQYIKFFIGSNSFLVQSDLDIYNNLIFADLDRDGVVTTYGYATGRIDSFYLSLSEDLEPFEKYYFHPKERCYAKVIDQGKYIISEGIHFEFQKGNINPAIDLGSFEDKIKVKKSYYLIDEGIWYDIPKNKNELIHFAKVHFKRKIDKSIIKKKKILGTLVWLNS